MAEDFVQRQRRLPHWEQRGGTYFLTWHSVAGVRLEPPEMDIVAANLRFWEGRKFLLHIGVVMPTHVHVLLTPLQEDKNKPNDLGSIMHSLKSYTAHEINKRRQTSGQVWQEEEHNRLIRSTSHYEAVVSYIFNNPVKADLARDPNTYRWLLYQEKQ